MKKFATSQRTDKAIVFALENASNRHRPVNTIDLLCGLIKERYGIAGQTLIECCYLDAEVINSHLTHEFANAPGENLFDYLEVADHLSNVLGHNYVGTEHLLLSILGDEKSQGYKFLVDVNQECLEIEREVMHSIGMTGVLYSYLPCEVEFWLTNWKLWKEEDEDLRLASFERNKKLEEDTIATLAITTSDGFGFLLRKDELGLTSFLTQDRFRLIEINCERKHADTVRLLACNFLVSMLTFWSSAH